MQRGCQDFRFEVRNGYGVEIWSKQKDRLQLMAI